MVSGDSPAVARRRLRLALRRTREAKGLTQGQVADALDWSLSKVQRIESGDVTVSGTDLRALLGMFDVNQKATVEQFAADAKASRRRGWWDEPRYRSHLTSATMQLLQFESHATAIRFFSSTMIPGVLQTRRYAEYVLNFWSTHLPELSEEERATRLDVRMRRHEQVFERADRPDYLLILDESVLHREVGGPDIMAEQLQQLLRHVAEGKVSVRVVSFAKAAVVAMIGAFVILDLDEEENAVLYRESWMRDEIAQSPEPLARHRHMFDELWKQSYNEQASTHLIEARAATLVAALDR
jgi:transcriptional regulator with XRE-family HTH domain